MAEVKATEEIFRAIGASREKVIQNINTGLKKGRIDEKTIWLDESEIPEAFRPKNPNATPEPPNQLDIIKAETERSKAEAQKLEAQTKLEIIKGERDKPELLKKREEDLNARQLTIEAREQALNERQIVLEAREVTLNERENKVALVEKAVAQKLVEVNDTCEKVLEETAQQIQAKYDEMDMAIISRQEELDKIQRQINNKNTVLTGYMDAISGYETAIEPLKVQLQKLMGTANKVASQHYFNAEKTSGNISAYHTQKSKQLWGLEKTFKNLLKALTG